MALQKTFSFSYNLSSKIQNSLEQIDLLRAKIALKAITPEDETLLRWKALVDRIYWSLTLTDTPVKRNEIEEILKSPKDYYEAKLITSYKNALYYIKNKWLANREKITADTLIDLYDIACKSTEGPKKL